LQAESIMLVMIHIRIRGGGTGNCESVDGDNVHMRGVREVSFAYVNSCIY